MEANARNTSVVEQSLSEEPFILNDAPVYVRNAFKSFWQRNVEINVLNDLNLIVSKGKIYGLLGPSGCGKTTLLQCIIGRLSLDKGEVLTLGEKPGTRYSTIPGPRLGYMPQEDALDGIMSIEEILYYYGCLLCMSKKQILEKVAFLVNLLKLPSVRRNFSSLSGGQKRRVSFAVALIHDAELLILDEPTVGVDQILKHNIWNYLCELVESGMKTVIITTHYIEEARRANYVGMMVEGRLLVNGAPDKLISQYHRNTLEDVFLYVCANKSTEMQVLTESFQEKTAASEPLLTSVVSAESSFKSVTTIEKACSEFHKTQQCTLNPVDKSNYYPEIRYSVLQAMMYRSLLQLIRYPGLLILTLVSPAFIICLIGFIFGLPLTSIEMGIVNKDAGHFASRFLSQIDNKLIVQTNFTSWDDARQAVQDGKTWGALQFGQNFSSSLFNRYNKTPYVDLETIFLSNINVTMDGTSYVFADTIRFELLDAYKKFVSQFLLQNNMNPQLAIIPILVDNPVFGKKEDPYGYFVIPSIIIGFSFFCEMGLANIVLFLDKDGGKLERIYINGVTPLEVIFGFLFIQTVVMFAIVIIIIASLFLVLQLTIKGPILVMIVLCVLQGLCGTSLGILISSLCNKFTSTNVISMSVFVASISFGGLFWPIEAATTVVKYICLSSPSAMAVIAMRNIMYHGSSMLQQTVFTGFVVTIVWTLVFLLLTVIFLKIKN